MQVLNEQVTNEPDSQPGIDSKWPLPFNISLDKLELIPKGYFQARADQHPVPASDLAKITGLNDATVKANSRFFSSLAVLRPRDGQTYSLTDLGADYVKALSSSNADELASLISKMITGSPLKDLSSFIELRGPGGLSYDQLFAHIKTMARIPENTKYPRGISGPYVTGVNTLIDLLIKGRIISPSLRESKSEVKSIVQLKRNSQSKQAAPKQDLASVLPQSQMEPGNSSQIPISLNIVIEAKDATSIKELIGLIRELRGQRLSADGGL